MLSYLKVWKILMTMDKKEYITPSIKVHELRMETALLAASGREELRVSGLNDDFYYDSNEGDGSDAW